MTASLRQVGDLAAARRLDWARRCPRTVGAARYTEWSHFVVLAADVVVLVNVSLTAEGGRAAPRVMLAVHEGGRWTAGIEEVALADTDLRAGRYDAALGRSRFLLGAGGYRVTARLPDRPVEVDLRLLPDAPPLLAVNAPLPGGATLSWMAVPRLRASGEVRVDGRRYRLDDAPAYHDRNWGSIGWGGDFAWDWGFALPDQGARWSVLFLRLYDRARLRLFQQGVWIWRDGALQHGFRDDTVAFASDGFRRDRAVETVPRVLDSLASGASGVPDRLRLAARDADAQLVGEFRTAPSMRIVAPAEERVTVVHEVPGVLSARLRLGGEEVAIEGPGLLEVANG